MRDLTLIQQDGGCYIDSREVAGLIGKRHDNLLRDVMGYVTTMRKSNALNFEDVDFFIESSYLDAKGETRPCYLLSKRGCELVANKLTGEKGVLFTAAYVSKFNEMEAAEREELQSLIAAAKQPLPRLGEINACVRIIVRGMKDLGSSPEWIMQFLTETYAAFGLSVTPGPVCDPGYCDPGLDDDAGPQWYTAQEVAAECGVYSRYGKPHSQAVACILNELLFIGDEHRRVDAEPYSYVTRITVRYDSAALHAVVAWLIANGLPDEIHGCRKTYSIVYHTA